MKHKTLSFLLSVLMSMAASVASANDFEVDGIYYSFLSNEDFTVAVTCKGDYAHAFSDEYTGDVVIPETVMYDGKRYSVTSIGNNAFSYCTSLNSITIPNSVTDIGRSAFSYCILRPLNYHE